MYVMPPAEPLREGKTWTPKAGIHECTPDGCVEFSTTDTLRSFDDERITIETRAVPPHQGAEEPPADNVITRRVVLSREDGLPLSLDVVGKQIHEKKGTRFEVEVTFSQRRGKKSSSKR